MDLQSLDVHVLFQSGYKQHFNIFFLKWDVVDVILTNLFQVEN